MLLGVVVYLALTMFNTPADADGEDVKLLFQHDGMKVYRFEDQGRYGYFAAPAQEKQSDEAK